MRFISSWLDLLFLVHLASCLFMTGVIWYVQIVVYPQLRNVSDDFFSRYYSSHTIRTGFVVGPPMLLELASGVGLLILAATQTSSDLFQMLPGFSPLLLIWLSTLFLQIPMHARLEKKRDERAIEYLIRGNWIRTALWTFRSGWLLLHWETFFNHHVYEVTTCRFN
jgi:hypothetical protein